MNEEDRKMRAEFNEWAEAGRGEEMEQHHASIAEQTIARMELKRGERVLDLGCGAGWATRILARAVAGEQGMAMGLDISDKMIERAREASLELSNVQFVSASADKIPVEDQQFDKLLSIESFYYYADQDAVLRELYRVMAPGGKIFILINLFRENPYSLRWVDALNVPVHARSEREYLAMLAAHRFADAIAEHIPDLTPTPDDYSGKWFKNAEELREFKRIGALLLTARKPS